MKILIIASEKYFAQSLALAVSLSQTEAELVISDHESALEKLLIEEPTHVVICEYDECDDGQEKWNAGWQTYHDIRSSANDESIVRLGFSDYDHQDYLQMPFEINALVTRLDKTP